MVFFQLVKLKKIKVLLPVITISTMFFIAIQAPQILNNKVIKMFFVISLILLIKWRVLSVKSLRLSFMGILIIQKFLVIRRFTILPLKT